MMTSRTKQAISSIQLYVQRILLRLETGVTLPDSAGEQWKSWMKNYRIWEANRKVFLYPENWIEPELRDDKSQLYREFESSLLQNDLDSPALTGALAAYVEKLKELAGLEIAGIYVESGTNSVHLFGRTSTNPRKYFYRRWVDKRKWTPWESVDLDIEGNHLIPLVKNERLYLYWPLIVEKTGTVTTTVGEAPRFREMRLAWSEYGANRWSGRQISTSSLTFSSDTGLELLHFRIVKKTIGGQGTSEGHSGIESRPVLFCRSRFGGQGIRKTLGAFVVGDNSGAEAARNFEAFSRLIGDEFDPFLFSEEFDDVSESFPAGTLSIEMAYVERSDVPLAVPQGAVSRELLASTPGVFRIAYPPENAGFSSRLPFAFQAAPRTYVVQPITRTQPTPWRAGPSQLRSAIRTMSRRTTWTRCFPPSWQPCKVQPAAPRPLTEY